MSEQKKVIIDIEETERTQLGELSELENIEAFGVLTVKNPSERCRVWNVRVLLSDTRDQTDITEDVLLAGEIDAGSSWQHRYKVTVESPILTLSETYDTCGEVTTEEPHWAYCFGKDNLLRVTIRVKNETDGEIDNIVLNKTVPPELSNVTIEQVKSGTAEYDDGTRQIIWKDFVIYPHEENELVFTATANVEDAEEKDAGQVVVTYRAEGQQRSLLAPDLTALTEFLTGIDSAENEPNNWEVTLECSNESDLVIRLDKAEVYVESEESGTKEKRIDESPEIELGPGTEWTSSFQMESKSQPKCSQEVIYTPVNIVTKRVLGTIEKAAQSIPVYKIEYTKTFDPPEVNSFDKTPVEVNIEVRNAGTAKINEITVIDKLPDDVMPPTKEYIEIYIRGEEYTGNFEFAIDPEDQDPNHPHTLTFKISDLKDSVGELQPGESIRINYSIMAWKSRPEKEYPSPIHCFANTYPPGIETEVASAEDGHKIGIIYKKRRISAKKAINKGTEAGQYILVLVIENKGEVTVENVKVSDWIPRGFEVVGIEPEDLEPRQQPVDDGTDLVWIFERMNPGDQKKIRVTIQGEGEYDRREPVVTSD